jgi:hypothetical protein
MQLCLQLKETNFEVAFFKKTYILKTKSLILISNLSTLVFTIYGIKPLLYASKSRFK